MKNKIKWAGIAVFVIFNYFSMAQTRTLEIANYKLSLVMQDNGGRNGVSVSYNSDMELYYAIIAGNSDFPLDVFDKKGRVIGNYKAGFDCRGLWYNPKTKRLEGIGYGDYGLFYKNLNKNGLPDMSAISIKSKFTNDQEVAVYHSEKNQFVMYKDNFVYFYSVKNGKEIKKIKLETKDFSFASYTFIWTGKVGFEIGFFDIINSELVLFNIKTGQIASKVFIPLDYNIPESFNIAYCNNIFWVFDNDYREWVGYQIWDDQNSK